jgi:phage-related protein
MKETKSFLAYQGNFFSIEWYFDASGYSQPLDYFMNLAEDDQDKTLYLFKRIGDFGKISDRTKFNFEGDGIYAFKPQPHRFLSFFIVGKKIIITNAYRKKTDKIPRNEKEMASKKKSDYLIRIQKGEYYE